MDIDAKIVVLQAKIDVERKCNEGAINMRSQLRDANAIQQCNLNVFESEKRLDFLLEEMLKLQQRRLVISGEPVDPDLQSRVEAVVHSSRPITMLSTSSALAIDHGLDPAASASGLMSSPPQRPFFHHAASTSMLDSFNSTQSVDPSAPVAPAMIARSTTALSIQSTATLPRRGPSNMIGSFLNTIGIRRPPNELNSNASHSSLLCIAEGLASSNSQVAVSNFGYLRSDSTITADKVKFKLEYAQHRLDVEQNVRQATERMIQGSGISDTNVQNSQTLAGASGTTPLNSKLRQTLDDTLNEANARIAIFTKAVMRYQGLNINDDQPKDSDLPDGEGASGLIPTSTSEPSFSKSTKRTVTGKVTISPIIASGLPGKKTFKADIYLVVRVDGLQRAKTRTTREKWTDDLRVSVDKASHMEIAVYEKGGILLTVLGFMLADMCDDLSSVVGLQPLPSGQDNNVSGDPIITPSTKPNETTETWFDMEPMGQILVRLKFVPNESNKKSTATGIQRRSNVKKFVTRKGHKFAAINLYQVLKCASCGEFLISGQGFQCQTCNFTCHKKCHDNVISKCISRSSDEKDDKMDSDVSHLVKHCIPHRFVPSNSISVSWCCHCGLMLPIGKKQFLKCTECVNACHKECMALVPHFCGLPLKMMNELRSIGSIERDRKPSSKQSSQRQLYSQTAPDDGMAPSFSIDNMQSLGQIGKSSSIHTSQLFIPSTNSLENLSLDDPSHESAPPVPVKDVRGGETVQKVPEAELRENSSTAAPVVSAVTTTQLPAVSTSEKSQLQTRLQPTGKEMAPQQPELRGVAALKVHANNIAPFRNGLRGVGLDDFNFLAVIGKGNFGKVMLAEEKFTQRYYAIKVLKKEFIIENDEVESTKSEKRVFLAANKERHPFLVNMHSSFQTESRVYFVMEFVSGGDLMWHIQQQQFSEKRARFYACEVLLALEYFHQNNIVYRDLKLDNILLTPTGHIKIADYGLCKENMPHGASTGTFCGTPEFMAPEILSERPYTRAVDWWAFGVLVYEMLLGQSPFKGDDEEEIFEAIMHSEINYPSSLARDAVNLLQKLLTKDPARRLGSGKNDAVDIKQHPFFAGVDWDSLRRLDIPPPFLPNVKSPTDISNFDEEFTREMPILTPCTSVLSIANQEEFRGFTHISDWAQDIRQKYIQGLSMQPQ
ncbi:hypothetical protein BASA62_007960 [Batrachochytrium salamandrivorans]|nr:hypothetical protein BASA62_007960 [Batrachochytrium salamandrivorans]